MDTNDVNSATEQAAAGRSSVSYIVMAAMFSSGGAFGVAASLLKQESTFWKGFLILALFAVVALGVYIYEARRERTRADAASRVSAMRRELETKERRAKEVLRRINEEYLVAIESTGISLKFALYDLTDGETTSKAFRAMVEDIRIQIRRLGIRSDPEYAMIRDGLANLAASWAKERDNAVESYATNYGISDVYAMDEPPAM